MKHVSRREFGVMMTAGLVGGPFSVREAFGRVTPVAPRIEDVIDLIKRNVGVQWRPETVDGLKAGDPSGEVAGIVTTAMASLAVLREAADRGANLVITSEPTFYSQADTPTPLVGRSGPASDAPPVADPIFAAKSVFIEEKGLVVFRLSEHWRLRGPDPFIQALARVVGSDEDGFLPPTTLGELASDLKRLLGARGGMRVVGDRQTRVERVGLLPGTSSIHAALETLPGIDVLIAGEAREWESVEYARDLVHSGQRKGLILLGRVLSEDPGMSLMAEWLRSFVSEVPVRHLSSGDPYWRPGS